MCRSRFTARTDKLIATGKLTRRTKTSNRLGLDLGPGGGIAVVAMDEVRIYGRGLTAEEVQALNQMYSDKGLPMGSEG